MNTTLAILGLGTTELIIIFAVIILLFGAKKLPDLAKGLGQSIKEFKKASKEVENEDAPAADETRKPDEKKNAGTPKNGSN